MFLVMVVKKSIHISFLGETKELPFESAGFFGMCPVFKNKKDAIKYANGNADVVKVEQIIKEGV